MDNSHHCIPLDICLKFSLLVHEFFMLWPKTSLNSRHFWGLSWPWKEACCCGRDVRQLTHTDYYANTQYSIQSKTWYEYKHTFGHLMQVGRLFWSELVLHCWGVFDKSGLLRSAADIVFMDRHWQWFRQEPKWYSRHEGDGTSNEVSQPPCPDPAGIARGDSHSVCVGIRILSVKMYMWYNLLLI